MPSTHRMRLSDVYKIAAKSTTSNDNKLAEHVNTLDVAAVTAGSATFVGMVANGPNALKEVSVLVPASIGACGDNHWVFEVKAWSSGVSSVIQSGVSIASSVTLDEFTELPIYAPTTEYVLKDGDVVAVYGSVSGEPSAFTGKFAFKYEPLVP
jgi:hypothetical protein